MKITNKQIAEVKDYIIKQVMLNNEFNIFDFLNDIITTDNNYFANDINLFIDSNDVSEDYQLIKIYNILFSFHMNKLIKWLLEIKDKFLKYTKTYYSDISFAEINIRINNNQVNIEYDFKKLYFFADDNKDICSDYIANEFEFEIPNFVLELIKKSKW